MATPSPGASTSGIPMVRKRTGVAGTYAETVRDIGGKQVGLVWKLLGMSVVNRRDWCGNCWGCQW